MHEFPSDSPEYERLGKKGSNVFNFAEDFDLSPFAGTNYEDAVKQLVGQNYTYNMGGLEQFFRNLGARTGYDRYVEQLKQDISQRYNDYLGKLGDIRENSESSKVGKMLSAGENPDLLGTSGVSDAPDGVNSDMQQAEVPGDDQAIFHTLGQGFLGVFQLAQGIYTGFLDMKKLDLSVQQFETNQDTAYSQMSSQIDSALNTMLKENFQTNDTYASWRKRMLGLYSTENSTSLAKELAKENIYLPKSFGPRVTAALNRKIMSEQFFNEFVKGRTESGNNMIDLAKSQGSKYNYGNVDLIGGFNPEDNSFKQPLDTMAKYANQILDIQFEAEKKMHKANFHRSLADIATSKYNEDYFNTLKGSDMAKIDAGIKGEQFRALNFDNNIKQVLDDINSSWRKFVNGVRKDAEAGDKFAKAMLISLAVGNFALDKVAGFSKFLNPSTGARSFGVNLQ